MTHAEAMTWANGVLSKHFDQGCTMRVKQGSGKPLNVGIAVEAHVLRVSVQYNSDGSSRDPHFWLSYFLGGWPENAYTGVHLVKVVEVKDGSWDGKPWTGYTTLLTDDGGFVELGPLNDEDDEARIAEFWAEINEHREFYDNVREQLLVEHRAAADGKWVNGRPIVDES